MQVSANAIRRTDRLLALLLSYMRRAYILRQRARWARQASEALRMGAWSMAEAARQRELELIQEYDGLSAAK